MSAHYDSLLVNLCPRHAIRPLAILIVIFISLTPGTAFRAWAETKAEASAHPPGKVADLVDIKEVNPRIIVDIKYATEDNFTKKRLYDSNTCFLRKSAAVKLDAVQKELEGMNLGLKVWDCYRPLAVQRILWAILPDERYVANPETGSRHNRASAVDVTLVDSQGKELQMPTGFDDFSPRADHHYPRPSGSGHQESGASQRPDGKGGIHSFTRGMVAL